MRSFIILLSFLMTISLYSTEYNLNNELSEMTVIGKSTLHDWEVEVNDMKGSLNINEDGTPTSAEFECRSKSLKSGKSKMDEIMHDALNAESHPKIYFKLIWIEKKGDSFVAKGDLKINGVSREIELEISSINRDSKITLTAMKSFKMSLFNIEPPSALMGTIKASDEITVKFKVVYTL